ncbi:MAG TPA: transglycosylase SLT domain-containing protein [Thermoanaerobaculia bacterium]|nr:transglycosylase SLT domain-containing protein [Thermoanaerobaculia bacterium]
MRNSVIASGCAMMVIAVAIGCGRPSVPDEPSVPTGLDTAPEAAETSPPADDLAEREENELIAQAESSNPTIRKRAMATLALFYREKGRLEEAASWLERAAGVYPELRPFLLMERVEVLTAMGEPAGALDLAEIILREAPRSAAGEIITLRLPAIHARAGNDDAARFAFPPLLEVAIDELNEPELVETARILAGEGFAQEAARLRFRLLSDYTRGRYTEQNYDFLTRLPDEGSPLARLSFEQTVDLAERLGRVNRHPQALDLLDRAVARFPQRRSDPRLIWTRATSLFGSRQYTEVAALRLKPGQPFHLSLERLRAHALWRLNRNDEFLSAIQAFIRDHPASDEAVAAKLLLGKYYLIDGDDPARAARYLEEVIATGRTGNDGENLWLLAWIHVEAGDHAKALAALDRYLRAYPSADYTTNSLFWKGKVHEGRGDTAARDEAFRTLIERFPYSYYSYRARDILGLPQFVPPRIDSGVSFPSEEQLREVEESPRMEIVHELETIGLPREAVRQYRLVFSEVETPAVAYGLAVRYVRAGEPLRAIIMLNRHFRDVIRHGSPNVPGQFWEILYPRPFWDEIRKAAAGTVDPHLVAAIIRQESGFDPMTVSSAGAVGLMQLMPEEAQSIAGSLGLDIDRRDLFDPETNFRVGVAELQQKLGAMDGNLILAMAAYNAGESAVGRWVANNSFREVDRFIESIPYNETRLYVKNIIRNFYEYARIYNEGSIESPLVPFSAPP